MYVCMYVEIPNIGSIVRTAPCSCLFLFLWLCLQAAGAPVNNAFDWRVDLRARSHDTALSVGAWSLWASIHCCIYLLYRPSVGIDIDDYVAAAAVSFCYWLHSFFAATTRPGLNRLSFNLVAFVNVNVICQWRRTHSTLFLLFEVLRTLPIIHIYITKQRGLYRKRARECWARLHAR